MNDDEKRLFIENIQKMGELIGELKEFKVHVLGRIDKLERKEAERSKERISVISILISAGALAVAIFTNIFRHGGE